MNDPGLDKPIGDFDGAVNNGNEKDEPDDGVDEEEEEQSYLIPARWWYASTACPLAAGTFGPMANAFSICALVENWRVYIPPGGTEQHGINIRDPRWLIAVNAISLVCALIANLSLLLNMARRIPFSIAQPITIIGFWFASVLLIALISVANSDYFDPPQNEPHALTQAYYYAIFAAGIYQFVSYLMCVTVYGAWKGHYSKEFKLTVAQRTLMLQTISFLVYQHIWALAYSHIEGWGYLDAIYWADFTSLTVGIGGSYTPKTHLGRSLLFIFALGGIIILGLVIGSIRSLVLDRGKRKMEARMTEKTRQRLVARIASAMERQSHRPFHRRMPKQMKRALTMQPGDKGMAEKDRRYYEFEAMRKVQTVASTRRKYFALLVSTTAFAFLWTMGAYVFYKAEKNQQWTYFQSLYFSYTTLLTIGYGDFEPMSNSGKPFFVFWSLLAIPTLTILISNMGDTVVQWVKDATIWLGEVTVLPSDDASMWDQLKYGVYQSLFGPQAARKKRDQKRGQRGDSSSGNDEEEGPHLEEPHLEEPPGRMLGRGILRRRHKHQHEKDVNERLAADFEKSEAADELDANKHGNKIAEDEHHYRRLLLSEIRKVYADSASSQPKQYTYEEWTHYIELLGQDENDSRYHRLPRSADDAPGSHSNEHENRHHSSENNSPNSPQTATPSNNAVDGKSSTQWSWIGQRSPLIGDKDEPEWLLEKLFVKLEQSLQQPIPAAEPSHSSDEVSTALQESPPQSISSGPSASRERPRSGAQT